jgi:hypothetical protein
MGRALHHAAVWLLLSGSHSVAVFALVWTARRPDSLRTLPRLEYALLLGGLALAAAAAVLVLARAWRGARSPTPPGVPLRVAVWVLVPGWLVYLACFQPFKGLYLVIYAGMLAGVLALVILLVGPIGALLPRRGARILGRLLTSACLTILFAELLLRIAAGFSGSPLFERLDDPADVMERNRMAPGRKLFGSRNSRGYLTRASARNERAPARRDRGLVQRRDRAARVPLRRCANACSRNAARESRHQLDRTGCAHARRGRAAARPEAVIVALFVGNDIVDAGARAPTGCCAWFDRSNVMLFVVPERLARSS